MKSVVVLKVSRSRWLLFVVISCLALNLSVPRGNGQGGITYVYDELGRLIAVIDPAGDTARYSYDAVGNVLSISRYSSSTLSLINFTPTSGPIGASITIYGTAFSATASQNTVTFNGVTATVVSATTTKIVTTVPTGATTGLISVATTGSPVLSSSAFTVVASSGTPTITSFSPTVGIPGTAVTISGTNFQTPAVKNKTKFNITNAVVSSATDSSISTTVPSLSGSGKLSVSTPNGTATSTEDFFIPPTPNGPADVAFTGRMSSGNSQTVNFSTAGKIAMFLFEATAGQRAAVKVTSSSITSTQVSFLSPNGTVSSWTYIGSTGFLDTPLLATNGTHAIVLDPNSTYTGSITFTLYILNDVTGSMTPSGSSVTLTTTVPGQNGRYLFTGTANQRVSLKVSGVSLSGGGNFATVSIKNPNGLTLVSQPFNANIFVDTQVLPANGTYMILVDPADSTLATATLTLYDVPPDHNAGTVSAQLGTFGTGIGMMMSTPGQNAFITLQLTVGQRLSLNLTGATFSGGTNYYTLYLKKPDGAMLISQLYFGNNYVDVFTVPADGTYLLLIDPSDGTVGNLTVKVNDVPADSTGTITPGGSSQTVTNTAMGQNGVRTFSGTANQRVSINVSSVSYTGGTYNYATVALKKPDGSTLTSAVVQSGSGGFIDTQTLPTTGTYSIFVDPWDTGVGSLTLTLNDVPGDATGTITVGGSPLSLTTTVPGQNANGTFDGTTDHQVSVAITNNTMGAVTVSLLRPNGSLLTSTTLSSASFTLTTQTLTSTGTHSIKIDPSGTNTGSISVGVTDLSSSTATLTADYQFQNTRNSSVGTAPALADLGTNSFSTATVDGTSTTVLNFSQNDGLSLATSGVMPNSSYTIVMLFSFQSTSNYRRIADFKNGGSDNGLYQQSGHLYFYPSGYGSSVSIAANTYVQVVITRDATGTITGYVDGTQQFQFSDSSSIGVIDSNNTLRFFRDDNSASEGSAGSVARIRIYDGALSATQVAALSRLP
jgi:YD repeat-containing protein